MDFKLVSRYKPTGDQPQAIKQLSEGLQADKPAQTLLGVTGSGKTFTMACVAELFNRPTLVVSHNKTLAAQLYSEFKSFFPDNAVEYYVSYYDYYQPEAYLPSSDIYIEKDLAINDEIDKLRLAATSSLLSGRKDVLVVASVSCIYGMGNPAAFYENVIALQKGMTISRERLLAKLIECLYIRNDVQPTRGNFRVKGDTIELYPAYADIGIRISLWGDEIDGIEEFDIESRHSLMSHNEYRIYPANLFMTTQETREQAIRAIQDDLVERVEYFNEVGKPLEAARIKERVEYDIEMIRELGHCSGIENYSRYFDGRKAGTRPYCLLDFFPQDFLLIVDESHVSLPQLRGMYGGDRARKENLVNYGFRLPAAFDNRPLRFDEFESLTPRTIYVSATPADYEIARSGGVVVEQVIRPTGLLDPSIEVRPTHNQIDDLMAEVQTAISAHSRVLITTLTKRMAEELSAFLSEHGIRTAYIHSEVDTLERVQILSDLREGVYDVLVGVNLLREGLDLPEVSLVAILDADKEGFLRNHRSLTQTAGRAARNVNGRVIMYADRITESMRRTIDDTKARRAKQNAWNKAHNITPSSVNSERSHSTLTSSRSAGGAVSGAASAQTASIRMEAVSADTALPELERLMKAAAKDFDFLAAAKYRDEIRRLKTLNTNINGD